MSAPVNAVHPAEFYSIQVAFPALSSVYGLLSGPVFALSFAMAGLYFGKASDSKNRRNLLGGAAIVWSLASLTTGNGSSLWLLAASRFIMGSSQAATEPVMFSMMTDTFTVDKVPMANSILKTGPYIGSALASLSVMAVNTVGWRMTTNFMGAVGLVIGLLTLFTIKEPKRGAMVSEEQKAVADFREMLEEEPKKGCNPIRQLYGNDVAWYLTLGASFRSFLNDAYYYFYPAFVMMMFPQKKA